jgi:16S rRNA (cytosine1402-N4)-methyltransferase
MDKDPSAVAYAQKHIADPRFSIVHSAFSSLRAVLESEQLVGRVDGVLLDLGVSSIQLDEAERGFSFLRDGLLDMRMDTSQGITAAKWLASVSETELAHVLATYGEERFARRIAKAIVTARAAQPLTRTVALAEVIKAAHPRWEPGRHPATKSFQAIRIAINHELTDISAVLTQAVDVLAPGGRLVVMSFHSLEDRLVKRFMREQAQGDNWPKGVPVPVSALNPTVVVIGKDYRPSAQEVAINPRARSAILRVAEKRT